MKRESAMPDCELIEECIFFKKYAKTHADVCNAMIAEYCRGSKQDLCKRKQHLLKYKVDPPENMLPGGSIIRLDDRIFCQNSGRLDEMKPGECCSNLELNDKESTSPAKDHPAK